MDVFQSDNPNDELGKGHDEPGMIANEPLQTLDDAHMNPDETVQAPDVVMVNPDVSQEVIDKQKVEEDVCENTCDSDDDLFDGTDEEFGLEPDFRNLIDKSSREQWARQLTAGTESEYSKKIREWKEGLVEHFAGEDLRDGKYVAPKRASGRAVCYR